MPAKMRAKVAEILALLPRAREDWRLADLSVSVHHPMKLLTRGCRCERLKWLFCVASVRVCSQGNELLPGCGIVCALANPFWGTFYSLQSDSPDRAGLIRQTGNSLSRARARGNSSQTLLRPRAARLYRPQGHAVSIATRAECEGVQRHHRIPFATARGTARSLWRPPHRLLAGVAIGQRTRSFHASCWPLGCRGDRRHA